MPNLQNVYSFVKKSELNEVVVASFVALNFVSNVFLSKNLSLLIMQGTILQNKNLKIFVFIFIVLFSLKTVAMYHQYQYDQSSPNICIGCQKVNSAVFSLSKTNVFQHKPKGLLNLVYFCTIICHPDLFENLPFWSRCFTSHHRKASA